MSINSYIAKQFKLPKGLGGKAISFVMNRQNRPLYEETIRLLPITDTDSVLDIGCGNGYVLNMLARQNNCEFTGIDISASIINAAIKRNRRSIKNGRMRFINRNISETSFEDNSFSKAYTINTVYFWENLDTTMAEIWRILKPNGLFINTLYTNETLSRFSHTQFGYKRFTAEQLTEAGLNAGFAVNTVPILHGAAYCFLYNKLCICQS